MNALASLLMLTMLLPGCSLVIVHMLDQAPQAPPSYIDYARSRDSVEKYLGKPADTFEGLDGVVATYTYRVFPEPAAHFMGCRLKKAECYVLCTVATLGLCEVGAFPASLMSLILHYPLSQVRRIDVTYDDEDQVKTIGPWR